VLDPARHDRGIVEIDRACAAPAAQRPPVDNGADVSGVASLAEGHSASHRLLIAFDAPGDGPAHVALDIGDESLF